MNKRLTTFALAALLLLPASAGAQWGGPPAQQGFRASGQAAWPSAPGGIEGVLNPRVVRGSDAGLIIGGATTLGVGAALVAFSVIAYSVDTQGGLGNNGVYLISALPIGSVTTFVGALLLLYGVAGFTEDFVPSATVGEVSVELVPAAADSLVGASVHVTF